MKKARQFQKGDKFRKAAPFLTYTPSKDGEDKEEEEEESKNEESQINPFE